MEMVIEPPRVVGQFASNLAANRQRRTQRRVPLPRLPRPARVEGRIRVGRARHDGHVEGQPPAFRNIPTQRADAGARRDDRRHLPAPQAKLPEQRRRP